MLTSRTMRSLAQVGTFLWLTIAMAVPAVGCASSAGEPPGTLTKVDDDRDSGRDDAPGSENRSEASSLDSGDAQGDAGDSGPHCIAVDLFRFDAPDDCLEAPITSTQPCAYHAYGDDNIGGACCLFYCLVSPEGVLYLTNMSSDMDVAASGWTRSSDGSTTLFHETLSGTDKALCAQARQLVQPPANLVKQTCGVDAGG